MDDPAAAVGAILFVAAVLAVSACGLILGYWYFKRITNTFAAVAANHGGTCRAGGIGVFPVLRLPHRGAEVMVDVQAGGGSGENAMYTRLRCPWPDRRFRCEIYPQRFFRRLGKMFGMQDIEIGSPAFDERYVIGGDSPDEIRRLLSPTAQRTIDDLRGGAMGEDIFGLSFDDVYVAIRAGTLEIKKKGVASRPAQLDRFVSLSLKLFDLWTGGDDGGIVFVDAPAAAQVSTAICQICGEEVGPQPVFCDGCRTPHHEDCWTYFGACSTYGCGQKRFTRAAPRSRKQR